VLSGEQLALKNRDIAMKRVFISNLPVYMTDRDINYLFAQFGPVQCAYRIRGSDDLKKPFGYVSFFDSTSAEAAVHQRKVTFEAEDNDYNKILEILKFLVICEGKIINAERTKTVADDFVIKVNRGDADKLELTDNFFEMRDALEDSFEEINELMIRHKIVSGGLEEDEEYTYRENEQEAIRRIVEA
jgi:RNA recognition motif-containing protein